MPFLRFLKENWNFLLAGVLLTFTSSFGQVFFISIFAEEIMSEIGLTSSSWGLLYTAATGTSAAIMFLAGRLNDRYRTRLLSLFILGGLALACLGMVFAASVPTLLLSVLGLRFFGQGMTIQLGLVAMSRWYVAQRGRATAIAMLGFAMGQALMPVSFSALKGLTDWRHLWGFAALAVLVVLAALQWLLRAEREPRSIATQEPSPGMGGRHWTQAEMLRHPLFWFLLPAMLGPAAWASTLFFQQVHLAEVKGWTLNAYLALLPVFTVSALTMTVLGGMAVDRLGAIRLIRWVMLPFALAFVLIAQAQSLGGAALGLIVMGVGTGLGGIVQGTFLAETYGTRHIGAIRAAATAAMVLGSAAGPGVSGVAIDRGLLYPQQAMLYATYFLGAAAMVWIGLALHGPRGGRLVPVREAA